MSHALSYHLPRRSISTREFNPEESPPSTPLLRDLMAKGPPLADLLLKAKELGRKQPWYGDVEGVAEAEAMRTLARLEAHIQWGFWAWELIAMRYRHPIQTWGLERARLVGELWVYADFLAADAAFVGSDADIDRVEDAELRTYLVEKDGISEQEAEAVIHEQESDWQEWRDAQLGVDGDSGGKPDRKHPTWATPEITYQWSPVTTIRPGEDPIITGVGNQRNIIHQLLTESGLSEEEARGLVVGRPSEAEKSRRDRLAVVVHRLRNQHGAKLEAIGDVLGCHKSTVMRLARDGAEIDTE